MDDKIAKLEAEVDALTRTLGALIAWLPQSAVSPIRGDEAAALLAMLRGEK